MQSLQLAPFLSGEITNINSSMAPFLFFFETMNDENIWVCLVLVIILIIYPSFSDIFSMTFDGWEAMLFIGMNAALR